MTSARAATVAFVLPCYRSADNIERFLPSLLAMQLELGFRLIVVDDASPDDSVARSNSGEGGSAVGSGL